MNILTRTPKIAKRKKDLWSGYPLKKMPQLTEEEFKLNYLCELIELPICPKCNGKPRKNCEICKSESNRNRVEEIAR